MLNPSSFSSMQTDPSNQRALETLFTLISDVEQRLQIVKASISQTLPNVNVGNFATPGVPNSLGVSNLNTLQQAQLLASLGLQVPVPTSTATQGVHAIVQTPFGAVPVFIPTPSNVPYGTPFATPQATTSFAVPSFGVSPGFAGNPFGNFRL